MSNRRQYSAVVASPTKPQFHYDESDTQAWPTLSGASVDTTDRKEGSRKESPSRSGTVVAATVSQTPEGDISEIPVPASEREACLSPPPSDTMPGTPGAVLAGKKKRRRTKSSSEQQAKKMKYRFVCLFPIVIR